MTEFEDHADAAEIVKVLTQFGIEESNRRRSLGAVALVVVKDEDINALILQTSDLLNRGGAAVDSDQQMGSVLGEATFHSLIIEAIPFLEAMR